MSPQYLHLLKFQKNLLPREEKSAELISANYTPKKLHLCRINSCELTTSVESAKLISANRQHWYKVQN